MNKKYIKALICQPGRHILMDVGVDAMQN